MTVVGEAVVDRTKYIAAAGPKVEGTIVAVDTELDAAQIAVAIRDSRACVGSAVHVRSCVGLRVYQHQKWGDMGGRLRDDDARAEEVVVQ